MRSGTRSLSFLRGEGVHGLNFLANCYSRFPLPVWPNRLINYLKQKYLVLSRWPPGCVPATLSDFPVCLPLVPQQVPASCAPHCEGRTFLLGRRCGLSHARRAGRPCPSLRAAGPVLTGRFHSSGTLVHRSHCAVAASAPGSRGRLARPRSTPLPGASEPGASPAENVVSRATCPSRQWRRGPRGPCGPAPRSPAAEGGSSRQAVSREATSLFRTPHPTTRA